MSRLADFLEKNEKINLGNLFEYLQGIAEGMASVIRWEAREKIAGQSVRENDLQHTFKTVFLTIMCAIIENENRAQDKKLDIGILTTMALVHDIGEIIESDIAHFEKVKKGSKPQMDEFSAFKRIIAPLPDGAKQYFIQAFRRTMFRSPVLIKDREARFFNAVENLGHWKRALHECRLGNLHFAPKCLDWQLEALEKYSEEFTSLKKLYEPHIEQAKSYLKNFGNQRQKYVEEFKRRGGKKEDFPF